MKTMKLHGKMIIGLCGLLLLSGITGSAKAGACTTDADGTTTGAIYSFTVPATIALTGSEAPGAELWSSSPAVVGSKTVFINCPGGAGSSGLIDNYGHMTTSAAGSFNVFPTNVAGIGFAITYSPAFDSGVKGYPSNSDGAAPNNSGNAAKATLRFIKTSGTYFSGTSTQTNMFGDLATWYVGTNKIRFANFQISNKTTFTKPDGSGTTCAPTVLPRNTITLPKVSVSALSANGQKAGWTQFLIRLDNCKTSGVQSNAVNVRTFFDGPRVNATTGNLDVTGAANVQLQLSNGDNTVINLAGAKGSQNVATTQIRAGTATLPYAISYFATGKAGSGAVSSTVNFTIEFP